jgi:hypothetical protein
MSPHHCHQIAMAYFNVHQNGMQDGTEIIQMSLAALTAPVQASIPPKEFIRKMMKGHPGLSCFNQTLISSISLALKKKVPTPTKSLRQISPLSYQNMPCFSS